MLFLFMAQTGGAYYIKCDGKNREGKDWSGYLKINSQNMLVTTDKKEDASEFEIEMMNEWDKRSFSIKSNKRYLRLPVADERGLVMDGRGDIAMFSLEHDHRNIECSVENFKKGEERFYLVIPSNSYFSSDLYMNLMQGAEGTDKIAALQKGKHSGHDHNYLTYFNLVRC